MSLRETAKLALERFDAGLGSKYLCFALKATHNRRKPWFFNLRKRWIWYKESKELHVFLKDLQAQMQTNSGFTCRAMEMYVLERQIKTNPHQPTLAMDTRREVLLDLVRGHPVNLWWCVERAILLKQLESDHVDVSHCRLPANRRGG